VARTRSTAPLIGRERALDELWGEVTASARDGGRIAVVRGPAGIGKTRLLDEFSARARSLGAVVVAGRSSVVGGYPYGALADALAAYVRSSAPAAGSVRRAGAPLARLVPALADDEPVDQPSMLGVVQAAYRLVAQLTERRPMVLLLDDVHAADAESCEVLHALSRHARQHPLTLVLGLRQPGDGGSTPGRRLVETLRREAEALDVELEPLDAAGTAALATAVLGEGLPASSLVDMLHRRTAGNPYYVEEMVRWFRSAGHLRREGLQWTAQAGSEDGVPPSIEEALSERIAALPATGRAVLEWIAAAGGRSDLAVLGAVVDLDEAVLGATLESLVHAQLVVEEGSRAPEYRVRHPLIAECVYRDMSLARRRLAHRALAFALSDRGAPAVEVATHFSRCADVGDMDAVDAALRAADEADRALHYARAVSWYQQALRLLPPEETTLRPRALDRMSELAAQTGQMDVGIAAAQELLAHTPGDEVSRRLVVMRRLAALRGVGGQVESTRAVIDEALALAEHGDPGVARLVVELTMVASTSLRCEDVIDVAERAQRVVERYGAPGRSTLIMLRGIEAHAMAHRGEPRRAAQMCIAGAQDAMALEDAMALGFNVFSHAVANVLLGRFQEAADALDALGSATEEIGLLWEAASTWSIRAEALVHLGRFDESVSDALRSEDVARGQGAGATREMAVIAGARALVHRGDLDAARQRLDAARRLLDRRASSLEASYWAARGVLDAACGDPTGAAQSYARMWETAAHNTAYALLNERPGHVFALLDSGDAAAALAVARDIATELQGRDLPRSAPLAAVALGAALIARGDTAGGVTEVERGLALRHGVDGPLIPAETELRAGEALLAAGLVERACALLDAAHTALDGMGAVWLRDRARAALRSAGRGTPSPAGLATAADVARADLTIRETEVAQLAAAGLRSRSIGVRLGISERTVENHLASAYAKLGVHSRAELIARVGDRARQAG